MNPFSVSQVIDRSRATPRFLIWLLQVGIFGLSGLLAFLLRFEFRIHDSYWAHLAFALPIWIVVKTVVFRVLELDRGWWSHASVPDLVRLGFGNIAGSTLSVFVLLLIAPPGFPRSILLLDLLLCAQATASLRILARAVRLIATRSAVSEQTKRIAIYGAGDAGVMLLRELRGNPRLDYQVMGFIDDLRAKKGMRIQLVPVLGTGDDLPMLAEKYRLSEVLIAIPSASGPQMTAILKRCHDAGVRCKTIPGLADVIEGPGVVSQIRDVNVEDLLGRTPVHLEMSAITTKLAGEVVLVTGAAGSIGSELCRQIARFDPAEIVGYEVAETALFHLEREMRDKLPRSKFYPAIGSIQNRERFAEVIVAHRPAIIFHAAAYKHVPMMEMHAIEAVENNILGTWTVASVAAQYGVRDFVMISSDKAVRPTSVMGVTKRVAELLIRSLQSGGTNFVSVRFGNVLGSNGSVVPIFKQQIASGGPVCVTHPEMRRFFMTIPEAAQLVLQASTMGKGGEIFVLDMGQPVKILDLAENLILLSGLQPGKDIEIKFTGLRPGEKLYEELSLYEENTLPTPHEKIKVFAGSSLDAREMQVGIEMFRALSTARDEQALLIELKRLVPDYSPSAEFLKRVIAYPEMIESMPASATRARPELLAEASA